MRLRALWASWPLSSVILSQSVWPTTKPIARFRSASFCSSRSAQRTFRAGQGTGCTVTFGRAASEWKPYRLSSAANDGELVVNTNKQTKKETTQPQRWTSYPFLAGLRRARGVIVGQLEVVVQACHVFPFPLPADLQAIQLVCTRGKKVTRSRSEQPNLQKEGSPPPNNISSVLN